MSTVLIVDDSATDRRLARGMLEQHPELQVLYAVNGRDALRQMELNVPDVVVTDLQMPEMNGLELTRRIKQEYPLIPVVLMTAQGSEEIAVQALQEGAASYVPKRLLAEDLGSRVLSVLAAARTHRGTTRLMNRVQSVSYVMENDLSLLTGLAGFLQESLFSRGLCDETERVRVGIALEEALLNAYYHGNLEVSSELRDRDYTTFYEVARKRCVEAPYWDRKIFVHAEFETNLAKFVIRDEGPGFDVSTLPDPTAPEFLERPSGRGILLMRTFMDEVRYNDRGNEVTLVKRRAVPVPAAEFPAQETSL